MTTTLMVVLGAPALLVLLAVVMVEVRTLCGACPAHARFAWLHAGWPASAPDDTGRDFRRGAGPSIVTGVEGE